MNKLEYINLPEEYRSSRKQQQNQEQHHTCLLNNKNAAEKGLGVDLCGRRIIN